MNEKAYTARVVSIGPLHHEMKDKKPMEDHKKGYLRDLTEITDRSEDDCRAVVRKRAEELSDFYAQFIRDNRDKLKVTAGQGQQDQLVEIILRDAVFIILFLLRFRFPVLRKKEDPILGNTQMLVDISRDMLLFENQLPFFILNDLVNEFVRNNQSVRERIGRARVDMVELLRYFFKMQMQLEFEESSWGKIRSTEIKHFLDILRSLHLPPNGDSEVELETITTTNITKLYQAGVGFKVGRRKGLFDPKFGKGILEIPKLIIGEETEISISNLLAFEQCFHKDHRIKDYVLLMNRLITTEKDVELMVDNGIFENRLSDNEEGLLFINRLGKGLVLDFHNFCYGTLCEKLNTYSRRRRNIWMANLRQKHFSTPWSIISFIAAGAVIIFAVMQTVFSVLSYTKGLQH